MSFSIVYYLHISFFFSNFAAFFVFRVIFMKRIGILGLLLVFSFGLFAQRAHQVSIPYMMGFEQEGSDSLELADEWVLNCGAAADKCLDRWEVGSHIASDGSRSLYVVDTLGDLGFCHKANLQFAYRDMVLPVGDYYLSFDWQNGGNEKNVLYVGWVPYTDSSKGPVTLIKASTTTGVLPTTLQNGNCSGALYGQNKWQQYVFPYPISVDSASSATQTYRLYVAWGNGGGRKTDDFGACVDNIQLVDARCVAPYDVEVHSLACDTVEVSWKGGADSYVVQYRRQGGRWLNLAYDPTAGNKVLLEGLSEGSYNFRVRSICYDTDGNEMYSAFTAYHGDYIVYCSDLHCVPYFDLDAAGVRCTYGELEDGSWNEDAPYQNVGKIDYGIASEWSRHTTCWDKTLTDPNTGGALSIVPENAIASVRLGNPRFGGETEAITYTMEVAEDMTILLLQYAVVLQDPAHDSKSQPRFTLEIKDEAGADIDYTCGYVSFVADSTREGWHTYNDPKLFGTVTWKDWTTVGLHLEKYVGKTITIRLATYDCTEEGHFGYAYYTIDCVSASIETSGCGADNQVRASAPDGFNYEWRRNGEETVLGTTQEVDLSTSDSAVYVCTLTNKELPDCRFDLSVLVMPRYPIAEVSWMADPHDCKNIVVFKDKSFVRTISGGQAHDHYGERTDGRIWDFGDGVQSDKAEVTHVFPAEGGSFQVSMATWLGEAREGSCYVDTVITIKLPAIMDTYLEIDTTVCEGETVNMRSYGGMIYSATGDYEMEKQLPNGCQQNTTLHMVVLPFSPTEIDTVVCYGDTLTMDGHIYESREDGVWEIVYPSAPCDSVVRVSVQYAEPLLPEIAITQMGDSLDAAIVQIEGTGYTYYRVDNGEAQTDTELQMAEAGEYVFTFYNEYGCAVERTLQVESPCLRDMIFQRWNDLLSLKNAEYNGGLQLVDYQWYEDGVLLEGETKSYYYAVEGLKMGSRYHCAVHLADGSAQETCEYVAVDLVSGTSEAGVSSKKVRGGETIRVVSDVPCKVVCYNPMGVRMLTQEVEAGQTDVVIALPEGIYVVIIKN